MKTFLRKSFNHITLRPPFDEDEDRTISNLEEKKSAKVKVVISSWEIPLIYANVHIPGNDQNRSFSFVGYCRFKCWASILENANMMFCEENVFNSETIFEEHGLYIGICRWSIRANDVKWKIFSKAVLVLEWGVKGALNDEGLF